MDKIDRLNRIEAEAKALRAEIEKEKEAAKKLVYDNRKVYVCMLGKWAYLTYDAEVPQYRWVYFKQGKSFEFYSGRKTAQLALDEPDRYNSNVAVHEFKDMASAAMFIESREK